MFYIQKRISLIVFLLFVPCVYSGKILVSFKPNGKGLVEKKVDRNLLRQCKTYTNLKKDFVLPHGVVETFPLHKIRYNDFLPLTPYLKLLQKNPFSSHKKIFRKALELQNQPNLTSNSIEELINLLNTANYLDVISPAVINAIALQVGMMFPGNKKERERLRIMLPAEMYELVEKQYHAHMRKIMPQAFLPILLWLKFSTPIFLTVSIRPSTFRRCVFMAITIIVSIFLPMFAIFAFTHTSSRFRQGLHSPLFHSEHQRQASLNSGSSSLLILRPWIFWSYSYITIWHIIRNHFRNGLLYRL